MKVLLIGGTGTISTDVTRLCITKGWDVTLINRGNKNHDMPVSQWSFDINDESAILAMLEGEHFDVVANFINYTIDQVERDIRLFSDKTDQYIFISTASAYQKPRIHYMTTESTVLSNPYWEYSRDKIACEERLVDEYRQNGFPITIVRPSHTYDEKKIPISIHGGKGAWSTLKRIMEGKPVLVPGDGATCWPITHSSDFAKGFVGLMGKSSAIGEAVHITSDEALCWNQLYAIIGKALGVEPKLAHVSTDFIVAARPSYEGPLHGDKSVNVIFDNSKIKRLVPDFVATVSADQGLRMAVDYHLNNPAAQVEDPDFDHFTDVIIQAQMEAVDRVRELL